MILSWGDMYQVEKCRLNIFFALLYMYTEPDLGEGQRNPRPRASIK